MSIQDKYCVHSSQNGAFQLRVIPSCEFALQGIVNQTQVLFQIKTGEVPEEESVKREPIDLAIVLDRSGSMNGDKLNFSKEAITKVIENLASNDTLHFIVYDSKADVVFANGDLNNKDDLIRKVQAVRTGGSTDISAGLKLGQELLLKHANANNNRTQRIYLFSDGLANSGLKSHGELFDLTRKIHNDRISTCTFGIGDDFDEDLLKGIAENGHSYYFYIEKSDEIEQKVSNALGALLKSLGKNAILKVRGKNGGIVKKIYGFEDLVKGADIGDIKQNNLKNIVVELEVTPSGNQSEVLSYELTYIPRNEKTSATVSGTLSLSFTENENDLSLKNEEVLVALTIQRSADHDSEIVKLLEERKVKEAIELKEKDVAMLQEQLPRDSTGRIQSTLKKATEFLDDIRSQNKSEKHMMKAAKYHRSLKRQDSADWLQMM